MDYTNKLKQTAVHWATPVASGRGGFTFDDPVEITVRWQGKRVNFKTPTGEEKISQAVVYSETALAVGEYLYEGYEIDLDSDYTDPETITNAFRIEAVEPSVALDGSKSLYKAYL